MWRVRQVTHPVRDRRAIVRGRLDGFPDEGSLLDMWTVVGRLFTLLRPPSSCSPTGDLVDDIVVHRVFGNFEVEQTGATTNL